MQVGMFLAKKAPAVGQGSHLKKAQLHLLLLLLMLLRKPCSAATWH